MLTEHTFLRMQSTAAKARFRRHAKALTDELIAPLQLRPLVRRHPWLSLGGAMLTGFLAVGGKPRQSAAEVAPKAARLPGPLRAMLREARRLATSAIGAGLLGGWRSSRPPMATGAADEAAAAEVPDPTPGAEAG